MKKNTQIYILLLCFFILSFSVLISACSLKAGEEKFISVNYLTDDVTIKEIHTGYIQNKGVYKVVMDESLENGVYMIESADQGEAYILFKGVDRDYTQMSFNIEDKELVISYKTQPQEGFRRNSLFLVKKKDISAFDTIRLLHNGKEDYFKKVYGLN